jgi:hypothetical protein
MKIKIKDLKLSDKESKNYIIEGVSFFRHTIRVHHKAGVKEIKLIEKKMIREAKKNTKHAGWKAYAIEWMRFINCLCFPMKGGKYRKEADNFVEEWPCAAKPLLHRAMVMCSTMMEGLTAMEASWCFDSWLEEEKGNRMYPAGYKLLNGGVVKAPKREGGKKVKHNDVSHMLNLVSLDITSTLDEIVPTYVFSRDAGEA